jgi:hypothetical protein
MVGLLFSTGSAFAAGGTTLNDHFDEKWGSADVSATNYGGYAIVEATNVTSTDGCLKLKYKADRRGWVNPPDARDSVGDLARICEGDAAASGPGSHRVELPPFVSLDHVSFEFCKIRTLRRDDCETKVLRP